METSGSGGHWSEGFDKQEQHEGPMSRGVMDSKSGQALTEHMLCVDVTSGRGVDIGEKLYKSEFLVTNNKVHQPKRNE